MNRRQFLINLCALGGCAGIGGMLLDSRQSKIQPLPKAPIQNPSQAEAKERHDVRKAKEIFENIVAAGFEPREAMFWEKTSDGFVRCLLCPTFCTLKPYERGRCRVRVSLENRLVTLVYGKPCSVAIDPIEKKPVFHLLPGSKSFSIATAGCLLGCRYCQNWQISQVKPEDIGHEDLPPENVVEAAISTKCKSIAYTYTEPTIFYEYMYDTARIAKGKGLYNVVVSCGYINPEPLKMLAPFLDVMKVDLKGFTEKFYRSVCGGRLEPVLQTLCLLKECKVLIDIVTLVVPTLNDDSETMNAMFKWIMEKLGPDVSLFLSRFHPTFQLKNLPPTPLYIMENLRNDAMKAGLRYVYLGNVPGSEGENTYCPSCKKLLVGRIGYTLTEMNIKEGKCNFCGTPIPGIWGK